MENLWKKYWESRSDEDRNLIVEGHLLFAKLHCHRTMPRLASWAQFDEIFGAACEGLIKAVECYDEQKASFKTYANHKMRSAILDYLRTIDSQTRLIRIFENKREKIQDQLCSDGKVHDEEIAEKLDLSWKAYCKKMTLSRLGEVICLSALEGDDDNDDIYLQDHNTVVPEGETEKIDEMSHYHDFNIPDPEDEAKYLNLRNYIKEERSQRVIEMYYYEGLSCLQIAQIIGVSESLISHIKTTTINSIKAQIAA